MTDVMRFLHTAKLIGILAAVAGMMLLALSGHGAVSQTARTTFDGNNITQDISTLENPAILEQLKQAL